jgi:ribosomal protein S16
VELKHERIAYWRGVGAQLSSRVEKIVTKNPATALVAEAPAA